MNEKCIQLNQIQISNQHPITIIAGTNVIEENQINLEVAHTLQNICQSLELPFIFKASFDKANRSRHDSYRGKGIDMGFALFEELKYRYQIPCLTDIHEGWQFKEFADVIDIFQIPAFLCRQTDLIKEACAQQKPIHIKKMQMLAPEDMKHIIDKCIAFGNDQIILCERGTSFGYHQLIVDPLSIPLMKKFSYPVSFDVTHSLQLPGTQDGSSGGRAELLVDLMKSVVIQGIACIFIEFHPNPKQAKCDAACAYPLDQAFELLSMIKEIDQFAKKLHTVTSIPS